MSESKHTLADLHQMQSLPLSAKIRMTKQRIKWWVEEFGEDGVYVSFSGGKDSTVLLHMAREEFPNLKACFSNTGIEFPEIVQFVKTFTNVDVIKPKMTFRDTVEKYGYPLISKEVSECVYGARKYLTAVEAEINAVNRTEQNRTEQNRTEQWSLLTNGTIRNSDSLQDKENTLPLRVRETHGDRTLLQNSRIRRDSGGGYANKLRKLTGTGPYSRGTGVKSSQGADSQRLRKIYSQLPSSKANGILCKTGYATAENIPSGKDRSRYACTRYQFMLDAPFEICNKCCNVMKKAPNAAYTKATGRYPITGQMASESRLRTQIWLKQGCNAYDAKKPMSNPMSFWDESDVLLYIQLYGDKMIEDRKRAYEETHPELTEKELAEIYSGKEWGAMCSLYGDVINDGEVDGQLNMADLGWFDMGRPHLKTSGVDRTGCITCGFGLHMEKPQDDNRFFRMLRLTNPKTVDWLLRGGRFDPEDGLWKPYRGMGYWFILMWCNKYGNMNYRFPNMEYYFKTYSTPETDKWLK